MMGDKKNVIIIAAIVLVGAGIVIIYMTAFRAPVQSVLEPSPPAAQEPAPREEDQSLGAQVYTQAANPVQEKIPEANPGEAVNPLEGLYTNPF